MNPTFGNFYQSAIAQLVPAIIAFSLMAGVLRTLGDESYILFNILLVTSAYAANTDFGLVASVLRSVANSSNEYCYANIKRHYILSFFLGLIIATGFVMGCFAFVAESQNKTMLIILAFSVVPFQMMQGVQRGSLDGYGKYWPANILKFLSASISFLIPLLIVLLSGWVEVAFATRLLLRIISLLVFDRILSRVNMGSQACEDTKLTVSLFKGKYLFGTTMVGTLMVQGVIDKFVIQQGYAHENYIAYVFFYDISNRVLLIVSIIATYLITVLLSEKNYEVKSLVIRNALFSMSRLVSIICALMFLLNAHILEFIIGYKVGQMQGSIFMYSLVIGVTFNSFGQVLGSYVQAEYKEQYLFFRHLFELPFYVASSVYVLLSDQMVYLPFVWLTFCIIDFFILFVITNLLTKPIKGLSKTLIKLLSCLLILIFVHFLLSLYRLELYFSALILVLVILDVFRHQLKTNSLFRGVE